MMGPPPGHHEAPRRRGLRPAASPRPSAWAPAARRAAGRRLVPGPSRGGAAADALATLGVVAIVVCARRPPWSSSVAVCRHSVVVDDVGPDGGLLQFVRGPNSVAEAVSHLVSRAFARFCRCRPIFDDLGQICYTSANFQRIRPISGDFDQSGGISGGVVQLTAIWTDSGKLGKTWLDFGHFLPLLTRSAKVSAGQTFVGAVRKGEQQEKR